jgi:hypothetical protein
VGSRVVALALAAAATVAGCQVIADYTGMPLPGTYPDFSDGPDPCASVGASPPPRYRHGTATLTFTGSENRVLPLTLQDGQYLRDQPSPVMDCYGPGTEASYSDAAGEGNLSIGVYGFTVAPSGPAVGVFVIHAGAGANPQMLTPDDCTPDVSAETADAFTGTIVCRDLHWMDPTSNAAPTASGAPFDLTVAFTAMP